MLQPNLYSHKKTLHSGLITLIGAILCLSYSACKKFVEVAPPSTELIAATVFTNDEKATAALVSIYSRIMEGVSGFASGGSQSYTELGGLSSDELINYSVAASREEFYTNALSPSNPTLTAVWNQTYQYIFQANAVLEGLSASSGVTPGTKKQLEGEAKFIRAFLHFYLLNYWGNIPYVTSTDYRTNALLPRLGSTEVYQKIITDLTQAENLLTETYVSGSERVRPNKWTAAAFLARVYLYDQQWDKAASEASLVINATDYSLVPDLNNCFLKNSPEAIWQLKPVIPNYNSSEGYNFILLGQPDNVSLSPLLVSGFEPSDMRRVAWIDSITVANETFYFPYKYKIKGGATNTALSEYSIVLRLAEQYLIRAEARARLSDISGAQSDLDRIRERAGLPNTTANSQDLLLLAIEHERQTELFTEWGGHRWLDLKRTGRADAILSALKGPGWQTTDQLYPLPQTELQKDPNLTQNPGY
jgi:hypothetical protein